MNQQLLEKFNELTTEREFKTFISENLTVL